MNKARIALAILMAAATMSAAQPESIPAAKEAQPLLEALSAIGGIIANADQPAQAGTDAASLVENKAGTEPTEAKKPRSTKNSVVLVTSGAAAGAALGAAMGKGSKGAMIGAAVGGAVGLVYDRMTYKNPGKI